MARCLITGSHGLIGQALSRRLIKRGHKVLALPRDWKVIPDFDWLFHLGAYGNHSNQTNTQEIFRVNIVRTWQLLQATKSMKYKAFVNISTSSVNLPYQTFYSASKGATELIIRAFINEYKLPIINVRPFSVYGEGEADFRLIPTIMRSIMQGKKIVVAPGYHDWIYVEDFIDALLLIVRKIKKTKGTTIDVGTGIQYSNFAVLETSEKIANHTASYNYTTQRIRPYDTDNWVADISFLTKLGWKPKHSLKDGLKETYKYYKSLYRV